MVCLASCQANSVESTKELIQKQRPTNPQIVVGELNPKLAKAVGKKLIALPLGLHQVVNNDQRKTQDKVEELIIGVHGYASQGYEWVYPLQKLYHLASDHKVNSQVYWLRWDWTLCPKEGAIYLSQEIKKHLLQKPEIRKIKLFGHSYGGIIISIYANQYTLIPQLETHVIASPVAGYPQLESRCKQDLQALTDKLTKAEDKSVKDRQNKKVTLFQWRTQKHLDGAFSKFKIDPQLVDWYGKVITLPDTYRGHRLGHNWSISWVVDQLPPDP